MLLKQFTHKLGVFVHIAMGVVLNNDLFKKAIDGGLIFNSE